MNFLKLTIWAISDKNRAVTSHNVLFQRQTLIAQLRRNEEDLEVITHCKQSIIVTSHDLILVSGVSTLRDLCQIVAVLAGVVRWTRKYNVYTVANTAGCKKRASSSLFYPTIDDVIK